MRSPGSYAAALMGARPRRLRPGGLDTHAIPRPLSARAPSVQRAAAARGNWKDLTQPVRRLQYAIGADQNAPFWSDTAQSWQASAAGRASMTIGMLLLVFIGGLVLTVVVLAIASWASELLSDSPHLAEGPCEEDHGWPRHTHQSR
jgi:hypothetical protein